MLNNVFFLIEGGKRSLQEAKRIWIQLRATYSQTAQLESPNLLAARRSPLIAQLNQHIYGLARGCAEIRILLVGMHPQTEIESRPFLGSCSGFEKELKDFAAATGKLRISYRTEIIQVYSILQPRPVTQTLTFLLIEATPSLTEGNLARPPIPSAPAPMSAVPGPGRLTPS